MLFLFLVIFFVGQSESLSCMCNKDMACPPIQCKGAIGKDICGCCPACKKVEGEACGGLWNMKGLCDPRYECKTSPQSRLTMMQEGVCVKPMKIIPFCRIQYFYYRYTFKREMCDNRRTLFCSDCIDPDTCCQHDSTCNPDLSRYYSKAQCENEIIEEIVENILVE